jgi:hypothetical protein
VLSSYITQTQNLLQAPGSASGLYPTASLTLWINISRGQVAGEGECIRRMGTIPTVIGQRAYNFSSITFAGSTGVQGAINVRAMLYNVGTGMKWIKSKSWEWFLFQRMNNPVPVPGFPTEWTQHQQGTSGQGSITGVGAGTLSGGTFYIDPLPDIVYTLNCDCCCYPIALASDSDPEAIPYFWTDAVPYFAAYLALMSAQTGQRISEAQQMFQLYQQFVQRARAFSNPPDNRYSYQQTNDPTMANKIAAGGKVGG